MTDRIWTELNAQPVKPCQWGAAVSERNPDRIITPTLVGPTLRMTRPELRSPPCEVCGNDSRFHCECEPSGWELAERSAYGMTSVASPSQEQM